MEKTHRAMYRCLIALFVLGCLAGPAWADISVSLKLDRTAASTTEAVRMVISVSGTRKTEADPVIRGLNPFLVSRGGTSSRVEIINNRVNSHLDYTYFLQPKKAGTFTIGPAEIVIKGRTYRSGTAVLKVSQPPETAGADRGPLFLTAELSSNDVVVEEQTVYTLKLHRQVRVGNLSLSLPDLENAVFKQLGEPTEFTSVYNGRQYQVLRVRYALILSREGTHALQPARMNMTLYQQGRRSPFNLFDDPFSTGRPVTVTGEPLEIRVRPFPEQGRPSDFSGLVGRFTVTSRLTPDRVKAGESATLTVELKGTGNVNRIPDLAFPELAHTKVYADQPVLDVKVSDQGFTGSKVMKWALVPEKEGSYTLPPLSVSFFDTKSRTYRRLQTPAHALQVLPGQEPRVQAPRAAESDPGRAKHKVEELGQDILPVHSTVRDVAPGMGHASRRIFAGVMLLAPLLLYGTLLIGLKVRRTSHANLAALKAKKAAKHFTKTCRTRDLSSHALIQSVRDYLNDRFGLNLGSLTPDEAEDILASSGVSLEAARELHALLRRLEDAVYTGQGDRTCGMGEDAARLIRKLEKELR